MKKSLFSGACTALVTPFFGSHVNYPMVEQLLRFQMAAGIKAVVLAGTTGEAPTLSDSEKIKLFYTSKQYVGDQCLIIAGTGSNCTSHASELSIAAQEAGADALLIVAPYYNKANTDGLITHYATIASQVNIPIIIYNVPSRTGVDIPVSVYKELAKIQNIAGVKEASTDIVKTTRILSECGPDFSVWSGNDDMTVPIMALGGNGVISVTSNVFPSLVSNMCDAALSGDLYSAAEIQRQLQPVNELLFSDVNPIPVKSAMKIIGFDCGCCRLPLTSLSDDKLLKLKEYFS